MPPGRAPGVSASLGTSFSQNIPPPKQTLGVEPTFTTLRAQWAQVSPVSRWSLLGAVRIPILSPQHDEGGL